MVGYCNKPGCGNHGFLEDGICGLCRAHTKEVRRDENFLEQVTDTACRIYADSCVKSISPMKPERAFELSRNFWDHATKKEGFKI